MTVLMALQVIDMRVAPLAESRIAIETYIHSHHAMQVPTPKTHEANGIFAP